MDRRFWIYPVIFAAVLAPVFVVALLTYNPGGDCQCDCTLPAVAHSHGVGLQAAVQDDMQLIFNVSPAAQLYEIVDGSLQLCAGDLTAGNLKHITVDVNDARLAPGERLPVDVGLVVRRADSGETVLEASAPAMYSAGHGYHFGDNFLLGPDAAYDWEVRVSPVRALRLAGAQDIWLEPVVWQGSFTLDAEGNVVGKQASPQLIGEFSQGGVHVMLSQMAAQDVYDVAQGISSPLAAEPGSRYFVVDVTDHAVNYEEKLPGAEVALAFAQNETSFEVLLPAVVSPSYGFHYGANVALAPGNWTLTVRVGGLDFLRHAGPAVTLPRDTVSESFAFTVTE